MAYNIIFYEKSNGKSEVWDFLETLRKKAFSNKDARIQYKQITLYIELLHNNGTSLPENITKHIEENIWELRPGKNRVFYFYCEKIALYSYIVFTRRHKKPLAEKLKKRKRNVMIFYLKERTILYEKLE